MSAEQVRTEYGQPEPQGVRRFPDKDQVKMGSEREASYHTGSSATSGRRGAELAKRDEDTGRQKVWEPEVVERGAPSSGGSCQDGPSVPEIRLESTKKRKNGGSTGEPRRRGVSRCRIGRSDGPYHFACRGWKHKEPLGGGPVGRGRASR